MRPQATSVCLEFALVFPQVLERLLLHQLPQPLLLYLLCRRRRRFYLITTIIAPPGLLSSCCAAPVAGVEEEEERFLVDSGMRARGDASTPPAKILVHEPLSY